MYKVLRYALSFGMELFLQRWRFSFGSCLKVEFWQEKFWVCLAWCICLPLHVFYVVRNQNLLIICSYIDHGLGSYGLWLWVGGGLVHAEMGSSRIGCLLGLVCVILNLGAGHGMFCFVLCVGLFRNFEMVWFLVERMLICL